MGMKGKMAGKGGKGKHAASEMAALKRGGAGKGVMADERAEYGMKSGGMVKGKGRKC